MIDTIRHDALFDPAQWQDQIAIIGCGGIGSHLAWYLGRLGLRRLLLIDGDLIEAHNIANQAYGIEDIGLLKVEALAHSLVTAFGLEADIVPEFVNGARRLAPVVFVCVDSMRDRKLILDTCLRSNPDVTYVFDGRMDASHGVVYAFDPNRADHLALWDHYWFPDDVAENEGAACGGKISVAYTAGITAGIMVHEFVRWAASLKGGPSPAQMRTINLSNDAMHSDRW
jgi:molybdopterin/thiamine biosynthesis adenylyltransferase